MSRTRTFGSETRDESSFDPASGLRHGWTVAVPVPIAEPQRRGFAVSGTAFLVPMAAGFFLGISGALPSGRPSAPSSGRPAGGLTEPVPSGWQPTSPTVPAPTAMARQRAPTLTRLVETNISARTPAIKWMRLECALGRGPNRGKRGMERGRGMGSLEVSHGQNQYGAEPDTDAVGQV